MTPPESQAKCGSPMMGVQQMAITSWPPMEELVDCAEPYDVS